MLTELIPIINPDSLETIVRPEAIETAITTYLTIATVGQVIKTVLLGVMLSVARIADSKWEWKDDIPYKHLVSLALPSGADIIYYQARVARSAPNA